MKKAASFLLLAFLFMSSLSALGPGMTMGNYLLTTFSENFGVEADLLYWRTCRDDRLYSISTETPPLSRAFNIVKPKPTLGWRVRGVYLPKCSIFADVSYTFFKEKDHVNTDHASTAAYFTNPVPSMKAQVKSEYQRATLRGGYYLWECGIGDIYTFGGASWIYLKEKDKLQVPSTGNFLTQDSRFSAGALEAGIGAHLNLFDRLGLLAECNGITAIGNRNYHFLLVTNHVDLAPRLENHYPSEIVCIPGIDARLEANCSFFFMFPCTIAIGYEHHQFFNTLLLNPLFSTTPSGGAAFDIQARNLGYAGVYAALRVNF